MGCVSSKLIKKEIQQENQQPQHHVVSLTSTTYGLLNLEKSKQNPQIQAITSECLVELKKSPSPNHREEPSEVINTWELMEGLEEQMPSSKKSPKTRLFLRGFADIDPRTPLKFLNQMASPRKGRKSVGKENKAGFLVNSLPRSLENTPTKPILKEINVNSVKKPSPKLWASINGKRCDSLRMDSGVVFSRRRSLSPLFDPFLVASLEKEVYAEVEEIKKMVSVSSTPRLLKMDEFLNSYEPKCPPGTEKGVVLYTTTLRGIRKTFEECNVARSIIESQNVRFIERDISMHSKFKEELRGLMDSKEVRVPLLFVKGRLIGGANELLRLDEEGKLDILFDGIAKAGLMGCDGCGGIRFVMCGECSGSCKVLGEDGMKSVKCGKCNENGLVQCFVCSAV